MTVDDVKVVISEKYDTNVTSIELNEIETDICLRLKEKRKEYIWHHERTKDVKRILRSYCREKGHRIFYALFGIEIKKRNFEMSFDGVPLPKEDETPTHTELLMDNYITLLSSIEESEAHIISNCYEGEPEYNMAEDYRFNYEIKSINSFQGTLLIKYSFEYTGEAWSFIEYSDRYLKCSLYGIDKDDGIPLWQEYILSSFALEQYGNSRMAFFNAYAGLDQYIEIIYNELGNTFKAIFYYTLCSDVDLEAKKYIEIKYDIYSKQERRLIDEKLKNCLTTLIDDEIEYAWLIQDLKRFDSIRNKIAHCKEGPEEHLDFEKEYGDLMWTILNLLAIMSKRPVDQLFTFEEY